MMKRSIYEATQSLWQSTVTLAVSFGTAFPRGKINSSFDNKIPYYYVTQTFIIFASEAHRSVLSWDKDIYFILCMSTSSYVYSNVLKSNVIKALLTDVNVTTVYYYIFI
jgi:hypothetical protein